MKLCRICLEEKPESEFGTNQRYQTTGTRDGLNIYCRVCNRRRVARSRLMKAQKNLLFVSRKPSVRVMEAVKRGHRTREDIRRSARLTWDETADALAELSLVQGILFSKRINGEAYFYERKAA